MLVYGNALNAHAERKSFIGDNKLNSYACTGPNARGKCARMKDGEREEAPELRGRGEAATGRRARPTPERLQREFIDGPVLRNAFSATRDPA